MKAHLTGSVLIKSMTGFGEGTVETGEVRVAVELKGVNHRFLDLRVRLPVELSALEPMVRSRVQSAVHRARIDLSVSVVNLRPAAYDVTIDREFVSAWLKGFDELKREFGIPGRVTLQQIAALPGAVTIQQKPRADGVLPDPVLQAVEMALAAYDRMRALEGATLAKDIARRLGAVGQVLAGIGPIVAEAPARHARRLRERIAALAGEASLDPARLAQEAALLSDRLDIAEEIVRLTAHMNQALVALRAPDGPIGKSLDFLMQEMNREANTLSSKAEALEVRQAALAIKSEVETMREQVQNLE